MPDAGGRADGIRTCHPCAGRCAEPVRRWRDHASRIFALPHPSWRNSGWLKKNPWFEAEGLPELRTTVRQVLDG